jgi:hypothetical protein
VETLESRDLPSGVGANLEHSYGQLPLSFEANQGQTDGRVQFLARGPGYGLFLTPTAAVFRLSKATPAATVPGHPDSRVVEGTVLDMQLVGARADAPARGLDQQAGTANYFLGSDPGRWRTQVTAYGRAQYAGVYPGIDLVYYGNQRQLEYDFDVAPGADPTAITLSFPGASGLELDAAGELVLHTNGGDLVHQAPVVYQEGRAGRTAVAGRYVLQGDGRVGFALGAYDHSRPLVIDPTLVYSTYLGGNGDDSGNGIAVDAAGNAYITGSTTSSNFPTTTGAFQTTNHGGEDAFVTKLNPTGTGLVYSTYLGGSGDDMGLGIALDGSGNAYITGSTDSTNFPTTNGAFQRTYHGDPFGTNAFVTKLNSSGGLAYSTYLGGNTQDSGAAIAVDSGRNAYVTGDTTSTNFPTTTGAFQRNVSAGDHAFVTKVNTGGTGLVYSTYLAGNSLDIALGIAVDGSNNAYVTGNTDSTNFPTTNGAYQRTYRGGDFGSNVFVTKLNTGGTGLAYSTYLGGSGNASGTAIAVDGGGNAYVTGNTDSTSFPTTAGAFQRNFVGADQDAFVTKVNAGGTGLVYSTFLAGSSFNSGNAIAVDGSGSACVAGSTDSTNFPTTAGAIQTHDGGNNDAFVTKLNTAGTGLAYSTYLGGNDDDGAMGIAVDSTGNIYITGATSSSNFPTTAGAIRRSYAGGGSDAFVAEISLTGPATHFRITPSSSSPTAGTAITLTVTALDAANNPVPGYRGLVHFTSTDGQATLPGNYTFTAADGGAHTFTGVVLKTAGSKMVSVMDTINTSLTGSVTLTVAAAAAASLRLTAPASSTAGQAFNLTATALDAYGNVATGYRGTVTASSNDSQATLPANYAFTAADAGVHTFANGVVLKTAGSRTVTVRDTVTATITGSTGVTVAPAAASTLTLAGLPASVTAGVAQSVTVTLRDPYNNIATGYRGTVTFSSTDSQATLPANYPFTAADAGVHTFTNGVVLKTAGSRTVTATDTVTGSLTSRASVTVTPAAAASFQLAAPTSVTAGQTFSLTATAVDAYSNVATGYRGTVHFTSSDAQATLPANYAFTASDNGVHTFTGLILRTAGSQTITATDTATGSLTGRATVTVAAATAATLRLTPSAPSVTAGQPFNLTATALDAYGNVAGSYRGTVHFTSSDAAATLPTDYAFSAADNGVHTFTGVILRTSGSQTITGTDTVTSSVTGTATLTVTAAAADHLRVTASVSTTTAGMPFDVTITVLDVYNNVATGYTGTVTFSSQDPNGATLPNDYTFTAGDQGSHAFMGGAILYTAGTWDVTATDTATTSVTGAARVLVTPAAPAGFMVTTSVDGDSTVAGSPFDVTVTVQDAYGNTVTGYQGTITFSSADPYGATLPDDYTFQPSDTGTVTFSGGAILYTAGTWDVTVTDTASGISGSDSVVVTPAPAVAFILSAPDTAVAGMPFDLTVTAVDPYGNTDINYTGTVTFSTSDPDPGVVLPADYTFTADDAGTVTFSGGVTLMTPGDQTITATDTVDDTITGDATVTVTDGMGRPSAGASKLRAIAVEAPSGPEHRPAPNPVVHSGASVGGHGALPSSETLTAQRPKVRQTSLGEQPHRRAWDLDPTLGGWADDLAADLAGVLSSSRLPESARAIS